MNNNQLNLGLLSNLEKTDTVFLEQMTETEFLNEIEPDESKKQPQQTAKRNPLLPEDEQQPGPQQTSQQKVNVKDILTGELAIELANKIVPVILVWASRRFMDLDCPKKQFELNASEKSILAPLLENCLAQLNWDFENPWMALLVSTSFIYGGKFMEIASNPEFVKASTKVKKEAVKTAENTEKRPADGPRGSRGQVLTRQPGERRGRKPKFAPVKLKFD